DVSWYRTTTADPDGANVRLSDRYVATSFGPDWLRLPKLIASTVDDYARPYEDIIALGTLLMDALPGLERELATLPAPTLVILDLAPELAPLPWEWMTVAGRPLLLRGPVSRTLPGFDDASRGRPFVGDPLKVLLIGDTEDDLPGAREEVKQLARLF